jgi:hypothetical protein
MPKDTSAIQPTAPAKEWQLVEDLRPFDWQDKVVITACVTCCVVCAALLWLPV